MAEVEDALASAWPLWEPAGIRLHEHKLLHEEVPLFTLEAMEMIQVFFLFLLHFVFVSLALLVICLLFCFCLQTFFPSRRSNEVMGYILYRLLFSEHFSAKSPAEVLKK